MSDPALLALVGLCLVIIAAFWLILQRRARKQANLAQAMLHHEPGSAQLRETAQESSAQMLVNSPETAADWMAQQHAPAEEVEAVRALAELPVDERERLLEDAAEGDDPIDGQIGR